MAIGGRGVTIKIDQAAIEKFARSAPVAKDLIGRAQRVTQEAKRLCPVSPVGASDHPSGQLRSSIGWEPIAMDRIGLYINIGTPVSYALPVELGARPHVIESHGDYPLRSKSGQVFGKKVHHPGNPPSPFLRPALDAAK